MKLNHLVTFLFVVATQALLTAENKEMSLHEALQYANSPDSRMYRSSGNIEDQVKVLRIIRAHPKETKAYLVSVLSKDGPRGRRDVEVLLNLLEDARDRADVVETVMATYQLGDIETPFIQGMAMRSEKQDVVRVKAVIAKHPDSVLAGELAKLMLESKNADARDTLRALGVRVPGKWQESYELRKFFGKSK